MALLAAKSPAAINTIEDLYVAAAGKKATVNLNVCNRDGGTVKVRLFLSSAAANAAPSPAEAIEWDYPLDPAGTKGNTIERTAITVGPGQKLAYYSSSTNVSLVAQGIEE